MELGAASCTSRTESNHCLVKVDDVLWPDSHMSDQAGDLSAQPSPRSCTSRNAKLDVAKSKR
eukprot:2881652-Amphidinium_carterae.1